MKNKLLLIIIIILLPLAIFIKNKEDNTNYNSSNDSSETEIKEIIVNLKHNNEILKLNLNDYLIGVVGQEMPASFNVEALKAQAIAARTFAYNYLYDNVINISDSAQSYIDIDKMKEKWGSEYEKYYNKIKSVVLETDNQVIKYEDKLIRSYYYAISNGKTEDSIAVFNEELPYLKTVDSTFDENVKGFEVKTTFTYENFCNLLDINPCNINVNNVEKDDSNRVSKIIINDKEFLGTEIRKLLDLRSTDFSINLLDNVIEIITKGYGHGVGMSQYGANYLANNGYNYQDILKYFYNGVEIKNY